MFPLSNIFRGPHRLRIPPCPADFLLFTIRLHKHIHRNDVVDMPLFLPIRTRPVVFPRHPRLPMSFQMRPPLFRATPKQFQGAFRLALSNENLPHPLSQRIDNPELRAFYTQASLAASGVFALTLSVILTIPAIGLVVHFLVFGSPLDSVFVSLFAVFGVILPRPFSLLCLMAIIVLLLNPKPSRAIFFCPPRRISGAILCVALIIDAIRFAKTSLAIISQPIFVCRLLTEKFGSRRKRFSAFCAGLHFISDEGGLGSCPKPPSMLGVRKWAKACLHDRYALHLEARYPISTESERT